MANQPVITPIDRVEVIGDLRLRQLWTLWHEACRGSQPPGRDFVDPLRLRFLLGCMTVFDVNPEPPHFVYRLLGQDIVDRIGVELTGKPLEAHPDERRAAVIAQTLARVRDERMSMRLDFPIMLRDESVMHEAVLMPIADAEGQIVQAVCGQVFPASAPRWRVGQDY